jgi:hypothetical protein
MTEFDTFLTSALAPGERDADRAFVARVQSRILWEERLDAQRKAMKAGLLRQILAILSFAAGLLWLSRSPGLSTVTIDSPAIALGALLALFSLLVVVLSVGSQASSRSISTR